MVDVSNENISIVIVQFHINATGYIEVSVNSRRHSFSKSTSSCIHASCNEQCYKLLEVK
jgi:hypothetical protein